MPAPPIDQRVSLSGADQVKAQLADLAATGGAHLDKLAAAAEHGHTGFDSFGGSINQFAAIIAGTHGHVGELSEKFEGLTEILRSAAPALAGLAGAASLAGLFELAQSATEATREIQNMAAAFGTTTEGIEQFHFALATVGVSSETANAAVAKMLAFLGQADDAFKKAAQSADALAESQQVSIDKADLSARAAHESARNAFAGYQQLQDGITKAQIAADRAGISYRALKESIRTSVVVTAEQARNENIRLRDSYQSLQVAQESITAAQERAAQGSRAASLAQERARIADNERTATLDKLNSKTEEGISATQRWLKEIGLAGPELTEAGTDGVEAMFKLLTALHNIPDVAERANRARQVLGRGWRDFVPAINAGGDALKAAAHIFHESGLELEEDAFKEGTAFRVAVAIFDEFVKALRNFAGVKVSELFTPLIEAVNHFIQENASGIKAFIEGFVEAAHVAQQTLGTIIAFTVLPAVTAAFRALMFVANAVSGILNAVFGTHTTGPAILWGVIMGGLAIKLLPLIAMVGRLTGATQLFAAASVEARLAFAALTAGGASAAGAFATIAGRITIVLALIGLLINLFNNWDSIAEGNKAAVEGFWELLKAVWEYFTSTWTEAFDALLEKFKSWIEALQAWFQGWVDFIVGKIQAVADFFTNAWNAAISSVEGFWNGLVDWISGAVDRITGWIQGMIGWISRAIDMAKALLGLTGGAGSATGSSGGEVRAAGGGQIIGPGTGTSDSVPAMLSNGEFVVNTHAAQNVGYGFLHALNSGRASLMALGGIAKMAMGGLVGSPMRMAGGGLVAAGNGSFGGMSSVHLHLGGNTYSLLGQKGVVDALTGAARKASITSAGKAPGWKR